MSELIDSLHKVKLRVEQYGSKGINEQNTKATLIQPVLRALGWDVEDLARISHSVHRKRLPLVA